MSEARLIYSLVLGELQAEAAPDDQFLWKAVVTLEHPLCSGMVPVYLLTKEEHLLPDRLAFAEQIVAQAAAYIEKSLLFIRQELTREPEKYKITAEEQPWLSLPLGEFPLEFPEFTFYESDEWLIRFADGRFQICDPFGIGVTYHATVPVSVDNLEDSDYTD